MSTDKQTSNVYSLSEGKVNLFKGLCGVEWQCSDMDYDPMNDPPYSFRCASLVAKRFIIDGNGVNEPANPQWGKNYWKINVTSHYG